jgi:hypothetical protein
MPTKRRRRAQKLRLQLTPGVRHFLEAGCYHGGSGGNSGTFDFDAFLLGVAVNHGQHEGLKTIWAEHQSAVKQEHRGETFAEAVLNWDATKTGSFADQMNSRPAGRCDEHERRRTEGSGK